MPTPPKGNFGPGIIGQEAYEAEREYLSEHKHIFGPAVIGDAPPTEPKKKPKPAKKPKADAYMMSVAKLSNILAANPLEVDAFFRAELVRPEGMRISALKGMLLAESVRPGPDGNFSPRAEVVGTLEGAIAELQAQQKTPQGAEETE